MRSIDAINRDIAAIRDRMDLAWSQVAKAEDGSYNFAAVTAYGDISPEGKATAFVDDQKRLEVLLKERQQAEAIVAAGEMIERRAAPELVASGGVAAKVKGDIVQRILDSAAIKQWRTGAPAEVEFHPMELKALMTTTAGFPPEVVRSGVVVPAPVRELLVLDLVSMTRTGQNAYIYMLQSTRTNAAAEVAEGGAAAESAIAYTEQTAPVQSIATFIPVTEEQLEDEPRVEDELRNQLLGMIRERLDGQILNGNGTSPNLRGILNTTGIQTQAQGTDTAMDAIYKAVTKVRVNGRAAPDAIVINPANHEAIRLAKTIDGIYLMGSPSDRDAPTLWGYPLVVTDAIAAGTVLVGAFQRYATLAMRTGMEVAVGQVNDDFVRSRLAFKAKLRAAFAVLRPAAFCQVTLA